MIIQSIAKKVDTYIENHFTGDDEALTNTIKISKKYNLPPIQITPVIGKFLYLQAKMIQAKTILEIGTLGGYSTIWLAKALPKNGKIITIEHNKDYAEIAKVNFQQSEQINKIELLIGEALKILPTIKHKFDMIFIDANKEEYSDYIDQAISLSHKGTIIICDNVIRNGGILEENPTKEYYKHLKVFNLKLAAHPKLESTIIPLTIPLTRRDYLDGLSLSVVK